MKTDRIVKFHFTMWLKSGRFKFQTLKNLLEHFLKVYLLKLMYNFFGNIQFQLVLSSVKKTRIRTKVDLSRDWCKKKTTPNKIRLNCLFCIRNMLIHLNKNRLIISSKNLISKSSVFFFLHQSPNKIKESLTWPCTTAAGPPRNPGKLIQDMFL